MTENDGRSAVNGWNGAQDEGERKDEEEGNDNGYIVLLFHHVILCLAFQKRITATFCSTAYRRLMLSCDLSSVKRWNRE